MSASETREIQEKLRALSLSEGRLPEIAADGVYGPLTSLAVSAFQQDQGLSVTGNVDSETWKRLNDRYLATLYAQKPPERVAALACNLCLRMGETGDDVYLLQTMLNFISENRFYNIGGVDKNGIYDQKTAAAVREYQRAAGLGMTGDTDKQTWDAIAALYNKYFEQVCK
ncbi:MAG: peptidoglycan-binding protein [Clostridia bacterium]|nr:peptidoglycan-binding protein [Clostridia bacterium]